MVGFMTLSLRSRLSADLKLMKQVDFDELRQI